MLMENFIKFGEIESIAVYSEQNHNFVYFKHMEHAKVTKEGLQGLAKGGSSLIFEFV